MAQNPEIPYCQLVTLVWAMSLKPIPIPSEVPAQGQGRMCTTETMELNLCQKYYLRSKLLPPHSTFADFEHLPSTVHDSLSSAFSRPQSTFARPLSTLGSMRSVQGRV